MRPIIATLVTSLTITTPVPPPPPEIQVPVKPIKQIAQISPTELPEPIYKLEPIEPPSLPVAPTGTYSNDYEWGNCTELVASRKKVPNSMGNANQWDDYLGSSGYTVSPTPIIGAIAQTDRGYYGHVAVVLTIDGGMVKVVEANVQGLNVVSEAWYPISHFEHYIYI